MRNKCKEHLHYSSSITLHLKYRLLLFQNGDMSGYGGCEVVQPDSRDGIPYDDPYRYTMVSLKASANNRMV